MTLSRAFIQRLKWNILPAAAVIGTVAFAFGGNEGLLRRHTLKQRLLATEDMVIRVKHENRRLRAEVRALQDSPDALRLAVAEHLLQAETGATIYRFHLEEPQ